MGRTDMILSTNADNICMYCGLPVAPDQRFPGPIPQHFTVSMCLDAKEARTARLVDALTLFADEANWDVIKGRNGAIGGVEWDGDADEMPWEIARKALSGL
jgi:hypothetical protein